jgi:hypothetical protein
LYHIHRLQEVAMPRPVHHTKSADPWQTDILPLLPPDLDHLAATTGAYLRHRAFSNAADLLRGLLAYALTASSLRHLGAWAVIQQLADLAPSAWLERLRAAGPFLQALVAYRLQHPRPRWLTQHLRGRLLLVDASAIRFAHGTGDDARLHVAYDLLAGQLDQLLLTDAHGAEHVRQFAIQPGDLLLLDAGYGFRDRLHHIQQAQADAVVRIYAPLFPLERATGQALDLRACLDGCRGEQLSLLAYYRQGEGRRPVRLLAWRLSEPQRHCALKRAKARAKRKQRALSEVVQYYADWVILVTTLLDEQDWPAWALWRLYGARWQVEVLFKRLKQQVGLGQLRVRTPASAIPLVWAVLLAWLLHEPEQLAVRQVLLALARAAPETLPGQTPAAEAVVSSWGVSRLLLDTLRQAIQGQWRLADVRAALPRLGRYLVTHPRRDREHQASEVAAWLSGVRRTRPRSLPDAI